MNGIIGRESIDQIREQANIEEIASAYVTLRSAGVGSMKGLCPFHDEKTPSFHVRPQLGMWHCFGCDEGGDVISFVQRIENLPFNEALEMLSSKTGVELQREDSGGRGARRDEPGRRQRLIEAHRIAEQYFRDQLETDEAIAGRDFLMERGFDADVADTFGVGYAPKGWDNLTRHLRSRGFHEEELTASGLVSAGQRGVYDRFRGRLIWPVRTTTGDTIGFGARKLYDDDQGPKYLNSPETPIYKKSQVLYGIDLARRQIGKERRVVVVEGYTDVMAAHLAGITTAIATCGTAFGEGHVRVVRRLLGDTADATTGIAFASGQTRGGEIIFTFDGDEAGRKAALRAFREDQRFAGQTSVAIGPEGMDPCDLRLHRGDEAVRDLVNSRTPLFAFVIKSVLAASDLSTAEGRVAGLNGVSPVVADIRDRTLRDEYIREVAGWMGMPEASVQRAVHTAARSNNNPQNQQAANRGQARPAQARPPENQRGPNTARGAMDPVVKLERDVLTVTTQLPHVVAGAGFDDLDGEVFATPAHRAIHDVVRSVGGTRAAAQRAEEFHNQGRPADQARQAAASWWVEELRTAAGEMLAGQITNLAVTPLPVDGPEAAEPYARGVVAALMRLSLTKKIADARGRLQRTDPQAEDYNEAFEHLMTLEKQRRSLDND